MKTQNLTKIQVHSLDNEDLHAINGGGFAYDVGRCLRFVGVYFANGTGNFGVQMAILDWAIVSTL